MSHYNLDVDEVDFEGEWLVLRERGALGGHKWEFRLKANEAVKFWDDIGIKKNKKVDYRITATEDLKKHGLKISKG